MNVKKKLIIVLSQVICMLAACRIMQRDKIILNAA